MWKVYPRRFLGLLTIALMGAAIGITALPAAAEERSVFWERWDVVIDQIDVDNNSFRVSEIYDIDFSGTFSFGNAVIPDTNLEDIRNILVFEDGQLLQSSCSGRTGTYCVESVQEGLSIVYYFTRPITNGEANFEIRYTVDGALRIYEGGDQLWWIAVPAEKYGFSVGESTITVELPEGYAPREGIDPVVTYGAPGDVRVNGTLVVATAQTTIGPDDTFEIRVQYPHNPNARVAGWQASFDTRRQIQPLIDIGSIALSLVIALGGSLGSLALWYTRGRDPNVGIVPEFLEEPPSDLPPAVVGTLVDERVQLRDILSTLIDLSHRGYIVIQEDRTDGLFGLGGRSIFTFKRTEKAMEGLSSFEAMLMRAIFSSQIERTLDSLKNKFYRHIPGLEAELYRQVVKEGLFRGNPNNVRAGWTGLGLVLMTGAFFSFFFFASGFEIISSSLMCLPLAVGLAGLVMAVVGQQMPARTREGAEAAAKWRAFREYLARTEKYKSLEEAAANFERFLPYAVAFGLERAWLRKFNGIDNVPSPPWYYPTYRGGYWSGGYRAGTPLPSSRDVLPGDIARAGDGMGGLNDLAGGISTGLESLSDGLTSMLNSAGSVMTSKPQSSGSWSSGGRGFSGGGSSGGGGSGGGSRGFG